MAKTTKAVAIVAIMLISCMTMACVTPVSDAASETSDFKDVKYWGLEKNVDDINDILPRISEMIPGEIQITSVKELESLVKALALTKGFDMNDVELDFDINFNGQVLGEKVDKNTISMTSGSSSEISLDIKIPQELITMLVQGDEYTPTGSTALIMIDVILKIDRHAKSLIKLNEDIEVVDYYNTNETVIHLDGKTNVTVKDGKPAFLTEETNIVDHTVSACMSSETHFTSGGFKFIPSDENDDGWEIDLESHVYKLLTAHNQASGIVTELLDLFKDFREGKDSLYVNPETHSGVIGHEMGSKTFDITASVDRTGTVPKVVFTNNAPEESQGSIFTLFEPFGFIFSNNTLGDLSEIINGEMVLDENEAQVFKDNIAENIANCKEHTKDAQVNVFFLADGEDVLTQTPIETKKIKYGESVKLDVEPPAKDGMTFIGWTGAGSMKTHRGELPFVNADIYLIPVYAKQISAAPTAQDFENSDDPLIWTHDAADENIVVNVDLIKENRTHMYIAGLENGVPKYMWKVSGVDTDGTIGNVDFTLKVADTPSYAAEKIEGKKYVYIDANLGNNTPTATSLYYVLGDGFQEGSMVDIYVDNGTDLELVSSHHVRNNGVMIHGIPADGFLIVGSDTEPVTPVEPDTPSDKSGSDNTMLIVGAVLAVIVIAAIAVFLMKRNS